MLKPDFDPAPTTLRIHRCKYISRCKARSCPEHATLIAQKVEGRASTFAKSNLCARHCDIVIKRERTRGLEICDRGSE
jgi:hypothetical protein